MSKIASLRSLGAPSQRHIISTLKNAMTHSPVSQRRKRARSRRRLICESLEDRRLLTGAWQNPADAMDVNNDTSVVPLDALLVVNHLNDPEAEGEAPTVTPRMLSSQSAVPFPTRSVARTSTVCGPSTSCVGSMATQR